MVVNGQPEWSPVELQTDPLPADDFRFFFNPAFVDGVDMGKRPVKSAHPDAKNIAQIAGKRL